MSLPDFILLEFNELCPSFLHEYMDAGAIPNFRRLYEQSIVHTTDAGEEPPNLEPWIQWPTIHSGLPYGEHQVFHLGDGRKMPYKCVAELLSDAGIPVGVFGSMNVNYGRLNGYVVPDPWDKEGVTHPDWIAPFSETVAAQVQESSKENSRGGMGSLARFMLFNGLSFSTMRASISQLLSERKESRLKWRRATVLEKLQYDLFRSLNKRIRPRFATFFCNSTAHFQHYFWRNMNPEQFDVAPPEEDHESLRDAIRFGYREMDKLIGRFLSDYPDSVLVLCTALSQQPWTDTTKCTFRPNSFESLLELAGIAEGSVTIKPVMAEEFHLEFGSSAALEDAAHRLGNLTVCDSPLMKIERNGFSLFTGCQINHVRAVGSPISGSANGSKPRFGDLFYMIHTMRSGKHHPDGVLWFRTGRHEVINEKVALTDIAPTILNYFGVRPPDQMTGRPLVSVSFADQPLVSVA